jgi:hypothetical protein
LGLSAFIFNMLGSAGWDGAPNFPPHDLVTIGDKYAKAIDLKYAYLGKKGSQFE